MAGLKSSMVVFMIMMVASIQMHSSMAQTRHVVGGSLGWTIPSNGAAAYTTWASAQTFNVGDSLVFNFTTGNHNVAEVVQAAYGPCTLSNPISITTTGPATIPLTTAGTHFFVCTVGTHCQIGQKLSVNVIAPATTPTTPPPAAAPTTTPPPSATPTMAPSTTPTPVSPPTTTPTPAPGPSTTTSPPTISPAQTPEAASPPSPTTTGPSPFDTPSPTSGTTPTPPSPSAAVAITVVVPVTFLAVVLALFY